MRALFCRSLIFACPVLFLVGCAEAGVDGPLPVYQAPTSHGGPAHPPPSVASDQIATPAAGKNSRSGFTPSDPAAPAAPSTVPKFRDYAAYSFTDRTGRQWLSQTLLDLDGGAHSERFCPIDDRLGTLWDRCEAWDIGVKTAELGIGTHFLSGIGAFVFRDASGSQTLAQTALSLHGEERLGRLCPIFDKRPALDQCSSWKKLEARSADLGIAGVAGFRGDDTYAFTDPTNQTVFAERLLSVDGSQSWHRSCASTETLFGDVAGCDWSTAASVSNLDLAGATRLSGWGAHVYTVNGRQVLGETAISEDGTESARRECLFGNRAVDPRTCGAWRYRSLETVLTESSSVL